MNRESLSTTDQAEAFEEAPVQRWRWLRPLLPKHTYLRGWRKQLELRKLVVLAVSPQYIHSHRLSQGSLKI